MGFDDLDLEKATNKQKAIMESIWQMIILLIIQN